MLVSVYFILRNIEPYKEPLLHDSPRRRNRKIKNYLSKLKELGVEIDYIVTEENKKVGFLLENHL
jgi:hypothetical protein